MTSECPWTFNTQTYPHIHQILTPEVQILLHFALQPVLFQILHIKKYNTAMTTMLNVENRNQNAENPKFEFPNAFNNFSREPD